LHPLLEVIDLIQDLMLCEVAPQEPIEQIPLSFELVEILEDQFFLLEV